ncbi:MAG: signal recognition particle-docking protein FtsY [Betaproteobacteria bacterium]
MPVVSPSPSWRDKLRAGLAKTRQAVGINRLLARKLDDEALETLESALLGADAGVAATQALLIELRARWKQQGGESGPAAPRVLLRDALTELLLSLERPLVIGPERPFVIMLVGVNGAGKTTSIGKLAKYLHGQKLSVLLAAGDTFRAAAREQLQVWGERNNVMVVAQEGGDPAAVMFDAITAARGRGIDVVLADTAGRLPTQLHLMEELKKIKRVIGKAEPSAPHEVLLVLDGNTGQNALSQLQAFDAALGVTGLVLTKLDGTAKGGVVAAIAKTRPVPLRFIGVGEGVDDLRPFVAAEFSAALLDE